MRRAGVVEVKGVYRSNEETKFCQVVLRSGLSTAAAAAAPSSETGAVV
jgi:hypothetical protein